MDYIALGKRIKSVRKKKHITQAHLAELCNISHNHLSCIEIGKTHPSLALLVDICNILEVSPNDLLADSLEQCHETAAKLLALEDLNCTKEEIKFAQSIAIYSIEQKRKYED